MDAGLVEKALLQAQASVGGKGIDGALLLDEVEKFIGRFVVYPSESARVAHTLWIAHAHLMDRWDSTPRIMFLSPEPGSGKTRALEVSEPLVPRPVHAVNTTPAYLFRKVSDEAGPPTILYDEIDTVFGPKAKENEDVRGMLNAGHRRGATAGRCIARGRIIQTEELPAYCAVALAGLGDLPDTIMNRSVVIRMKRRAPGEYAEPWRMRKNFAEAEPIAEQLALWASGINEIENWPEMPDGVEDRNADVWESLLVVADLAGGEWPARARVAAVTFVTSSAEDRNNTPGLQLLSDLREVFDGRDRLATEELLERLMSLPESTWADLRGKPLDPRGLSVRLGKYGVRPKSMRVNGKLARGYERAALEDAWTRYLSISTEYHPPSSEKCVTSVTDAIASQHPPQIVTHVASVTYRPQSNLRLPPSQGHCAGCGKQGLLDVNHLCIICDETLSDDDKERIALRGEACEV